MKHFESFLKPKLEEYIAYRNDLGLKDRNLRLRLYALDQYVMRAQVDWDSLQPLFLLGLREELKGEAATVNKTLSNIRGFFQFMVRQGRYKENPMKHIPPLRERAYIPFIFSPEQTDQLLCSIQKSLRKNKKHFLNDLTVYLGILILAKCGLRISEPLKILLTNYRHQEGTLYIEKTKFNKDRLIAVPKTLMTQIENYLTLRKKLLPNVKSPYLLQGENQKPLTKHKLYSVFKKAVKDIGLDQPRTVIANTIFSSPKPHSLRHSFAVNTLMRIKKGEKSPQDALPVLATYMGHRKYRYTAVYLKVLDARQRQGLVDFNISNQEEI